MRIPLAHSSHSLVESLPDLGLFFVSATILWFTLRYGLRIGRASLKGEADYRSFLKLFAICLFGGLSALSRFALIFYEWARATEIMGWDERYPLYGVTQLGVFWIYSTVFVASLGVVVGFLGLNLGSIEKTWIGGWLVRLRWVVFAVVGVILLGMGGYKEVVRPYLNRESLLKEFESTQGIDAYRNPVEVRLYRVHAESGYDRYWGPRTVYEEDADRERQLLEDESWQKISKNYRGFRFEKETELLDPEDLKTHLSELYVYRARSFGTARSEYLIRFVGETSVLDIWLSDFDEVEIFTNVLMSDVPDALRFARPYLDVMERSEGGGLKYHAFGEHVLELWINRLERLEEKGRL